MSTRPFLDPLIQPHRGHLERWAEIWELPDLADEVTIQISNRLRSSIGLCYPDRSLIRLHPVVRELNDDMLREILCHELAHIAVHQHFGRTCKPHGREWVALVQAAGFNARARLPADSVFTTLEQRATRKTVLWHHRCPRCDVQRTARRPVYRWCCATCRGRGRTGDLEIWREDVTG